MSILDVVGDGVEDSDREKSLVDLSAAAAATPEGTAFFSMETLVRSASTSSTPFLSWVKALTVVGGDDAFGVVPFLKAPPWKLCDDGHNWVGVGGDLD